jgi:hypothetical protein
MERDLVPQGDPLVPELEVAAHAPEDAHVRQEERDAHERGTLAERGSAPQVLVPMWNAGRHAMERAIVPLWNASSTALEWNRVTACGIEPEEHPAAMARGVQ